MTCDSNGLKRITTKLGTSQTLACFRGSNRARRSVGSDLNYIPGKLVSCRFFFLREFFSRALLSEHLEQDSPTSKFTCAQPQGVCLSEGSVIIIIIIIIIINRT